MKRTTNNAHSERRSTAAHAKAALVKAFHAAREAAEPHREARQAERLLVAEAREQRRAEREQVRLDEQNRAAAEEAAREAAVAAAARAEFEARELANKTRAERVLKDEADRKAARDLRYANRKARQA
ncbi:DUF6481 family protein [Roseibium aestuarii]|uniref:DUF6481 family protein n=1 Tax=Roseibium aestuarii TaxID=2600299 RepID=A0ABW4JZ50_9HYPH|nr:DUF6481 family protein [Roseibium aestuarii]